MVVESQQANTPSSATRIKPNRSIMKILFLSHSSFAGGAERCLCMLLSGLPRDKYEPLVLLPPKA